MIIMPAPQQAPPPTATSRELGRRIDDVVRDFKRDHPELTDDEVRAALMHSIPAAGGIDSAKTKRVVGAIVAGALAAAFGLASATGGGPSRLEGGTWMFIGIAAAIAGVAFVLIRIARRG